jgi:murein DD-endopeptidase MepM/ murein hydrolase activator NlpD
MNTSSSSAHLASLQGKLFFDYNGNGKQDGDEPALGGAKVQLENSLGNVVAEADTDSSGDFKIEAVPVGDYKLLPVAGPKFRYISMSAAEFSPVTDGYALSLLEGSGKADVGLMEGFVTFPFSSSKDVRFFVDLGDVTNPNDPTIRDWSGGTRTYKGHQGTDYPASEGTPVLAAAPGIIIGAEDNWDTNSDIHNIGNRVVIDHLNGFKTAYNHLNSIKVQYQKFNLNWTDKSALQKVTRGQVIATVGHTGTESGGLDHLHFEAWPPTYRYFGNGHGWVTDHYRDLFYGKHGSALFSNPESLWTKDNDPQYAVA